MTKSQKEFVVKSYAKYFGRAAGADTIKYYGEKDNGKAEKASKVLNNIITDAGVSKGDIPDKQVVNEAFQNLFGRDAYTTEMNKYIKFVEKGKDLPINSIVKKASKTDKAVYDNKMAVAVKYAELDGKGDLDLSNISKGNLIDPNFLNTVTKAADLKAKVDALADKSGIPSSFDGETFVLTAGVNTGKDFTGTNKNDLFLAVDDSNNKKTLTLADSIDGGKGRDTLKIVTEDTIANSDFEDRTIKGIEIVDIKSTDTASTTGLVLNTTADAVKNNFKEVTDLYITTTDDSAAGAITATVNGTTNVTATATATGSTGSAADADITVNGGKAVSATLNTAAKATITGNALTTVTVKGGTGNNIDNLGTDAAATTATGETLKSVTLVDMAGNATVKGNAIDTLTLKDQTATAVTTTITNAKSTALTVNLNNVNTNVSTVAAGAKAETITINSNGAKDNALILTAGVGKTLNIAGDAAFTLGTGTPATITDIVVTNSKGVTITDALGTGVKFTGGAGDDKVTYSGTIGTGQSVDAGAGKDTVSMTSAFANTITASTDNAFNTAFKNFEVLNITGATTSGHTYDIEKLNNVSQVTFAGALAAGTNTINNLVSGGTVKLTTTAAGVSDLIVNVKNSTGTSDVLNLELSSSTAFAATNNEVTVANVENININVADAVATGSNAVVHNAILEATSATTIAVAGNNGLNLTNTLNTKVTNFDASGVVANGAGDSAANLAVTFTSVNTTAGQAVTIKGGEGTDTLTGTAQANDTISGGKGADIINYTGGKDSFTGGEGADIFTVTAKGTTVDSLYLTIQDLTKGDQIDVAAITAAASTVSPLGAKVAVASGATFGQALDAAAAGSGTAAALLKWFQFESNTYLVVDNDAGATYVNGTDSVIKITGLVDLSASTVAADLITIA